MSGLLTGAGATATGYVIGSVPFGILVGRTAGGLDIRDFGSGSMGATNVLRTLGPAAAAATFALDVGKGSAAVACARALGAGREAQIAAGLAAMMGHSWPMFAGFRGGKSVATAFGGLLAISPGVAGWGVAGGLSGLGVTRIMSVGSLAAAAAATLAAGVRAARGDSLGPLVYTGCAGALIAVRHSANIRRLLRGVEPRVTLPRRRLDSRTGGPAAPAAP